MTRLLRLAGMRSHRIEDTAGALLEPSFSFSFARILVLCAKDLMEVTDGVKLGFDRRRAW